MDISNIIPHIEALIFASEKPLTSLELTELTNNAFGFMEDKINLDQVESAIEGIIEKYAADFYPFEMRQSGGGWQFLTKKDYHKTVAQLNGEKFLKRLSAASLETLAIIAYKQPITKGEVEAIRGVNSDYSIQKLLEKELIVITGRNEELPGKPLVYMTSKSFMDYFGINSPEELPKIKEVFTDQGIEATVVNGIEEMRPESEIGANEIMDEPVEEEGILVVRGNGELIEEPPVVVDENTESVDPDTLETSAEDEIVDEEVNQPYEAEHNKPEEEQEAGENDEDETSEDDGVTEEDAADQDDVEEDLDEITDDEEAADGQENTEGDIEETLTDEELTEDGIDAEVPAADDEEITEGDMEEEVTDEEITEDDIDKEVPAADDADIAGNESSKDDEEDETSKKPDEEDNKD